MQVVQIFVRFRAVAGAIHSVSRKVAEVALMIASRVERRVFIALDTRLAGWG